MSWLQFVANQSICILQTRLAFCERVEHKHNICILIRIRAVVVYYGCSSMERFDKALVK